MPNRIYIKILQFIEENRWNDLVMSHLIVKPSRLYEAESEYDEIATILKFVVLTEVMLCDVFYLC